MEMKYKIEYEINGETKYISGYRPEIDPKIKAVLAERKWEITDLIEIFLNSLTPKTAEEIAFAVDSGRENYEITLDTSIKEE